MPQENRNVAYSQNKEHRYAKNSLSVPVSGETVLLEMDIEGLEQVMLQVSPVGAALDQFAIDFKSHNDAPWSRVVSAAIDYTNPTGIVVDASGDLTTQADGTTGWVILFPKGAKTLRAVGSSAVSPATVSIWAGAM